MNHRNMLLRKRFHALRQFTDLPRMDFPCFTFESSQLFFALHLRLVRVNSSENYNNSFEQVHANRTVSVVENF